MAFACKPKEPIENEPTTNFECSVNKRETILYWMDPETGEVASTTEHEYNYIYNLNSLLTYIDMDGSDFISFEYNENNQVKKITKYSNMEQSVFDYNSENHYLKETIYKWTETNSDLILSGTKVFDYNNSGNIEKISEYDKDNNFAYYYIFDYNENGDCIREVRYDTIAGNNDSLVSKFYYTNIKNKIDNINTKVFFTTFRYFNFKYLLSKIEVQNSINNWGSVKLYPNYELNEQGYPVKIYGDDIDLPFFIFEYECK